MAAAPRAIWESRTHGALLSQLSPPRPNVCGERYRYAAEQRQLGVLYIAL
jgi:hypothetical protein